MSKPLIDIIVTHHDEPWDVGRKFFLMLSMQRNIRMEDIRVILVQDGKEGALNWNELFQACPYEVGVVTSEAHVGPAVARNIGIDNAEAEWVMFCDFDDLFTDVCSMNMILNVLPTNKADILWMSSYREQYIKVNTPFVNCVEEDFTFAYGKLFSRKFLNDNKIRFPDMKYEYESVFCTIALAECKPARVMKITTKFTMYMKTLRKNSYTLQRDNVGKMIEDIFFGDLLLVDEFKKRNKPSDMQTHIAKTVFDSYLLTNSTPRLPHRKEMLKLFTEFYQENKGIFNKTKDSEIEIIENNTYNHMINTSVDLYNNFQIEAVTPETGVEHVRKWLASLPTSFDSTETQKNFNSDERVIVYTGTRNTYENILSSLKSVIANTRVDKIYLLIEDDTFPFYVPDCVEVINVSNQKFFPKDGPNFNNSWSYMCMMRAAFPELFPQHSKILSLDIDIIITGNIDGLWNTDISDYYLAGVHETARDGDYINFGTVMMNLDLMRRDGIGDRVIDLLNTTKQQCPEQDAFNEVCTGKILLLPSSYNYTPYTHLTEDPVQELITHYAGIQYWKNFMPVQKYRNMQWDEILSSAQKLTEIDKPESISEPPSEPSRHTLAEYSFQRYDIINKFIRERHYRSFLEIGTRKGETFYRINAPIKVSVDPDPETDATYHMTSDDFFATNKDTFDIIFIDGLHEHNQVWRDVQNAIRNLNPNGVIIMHDCNPANEYEQRYLTSDPYTDVWQGTAWKAFVKARTVLPYEMCVLTPIYGDRTCGIIDTSRKKSADTSALPTNMDDMTYSDFVAHPEWMNFRNTYNY